MTRIREPVQHSVVSMPTTGRCIGVCACSKATVQGALWYSQIIWTLNTVQTGVAVCCLWPGLAAVGSTFFFSDIIENQLENVSDTSARKGQACFYFLLKEERLSDCFVYTSFTPIVFCASCRQWRSEFSWHVDVYAHGLRRSSSSSGLYRQIYALSYCCCCCWFKLN